ncbi:MAG: serine--tRNA ligase, partial [Bacilli bacterium]|nr:serine--tRNA ligase [Bacilli bacterium]
MLDIKLILEQPEAVKARLAKKGWDFDPSEVIALSKERLELLKVTEANKAEQNKLSASVPAAKKAGEDVTVIFKKVKELGAANKENEAKLAEVEGKIKALVEVLPNLPDEDLASGAKENNQPIHVFGKKPTFDGFTPKDHVTLCESLGLVDYKRAAKISGSGTWIYT